MEKTSSRAGIVLALSIFVFVQTAAAFEQKPRESRASRTPQQSHEEHFTRGASKPEFKEDHGHQETRFQEKSHYEHHLPAGYRTLKVANIIRYYLNGIFYQSTPYGYQVVTAPMGMMVRELPPGYYQIFYGGTTYYVANNTYYVQGPMGYNIVTPPQGAMFPAQTGW